TDAPSRDTDRAPVLPVRPRRTALRALARQTDELPARPRIRARPPAPHRRAAGQPGYARRADGRGRARLPRRIPVRSPRDRDTARGVAADIARRDPARAARAVGPEVRDDLEQGRFGAARAQPQAEDAAAGLSGAAAEGARSAVGPCADRAWNAVWPADDRLRDGNAQSPRALHGA